MRRDIFTAGAEDTGYLGHGQHLTITEVVTGYRK
jgi:hypothetical protein